MRLIPDKQAVLSAERLRELMSYDADTGRLIWRQCRIAQMVGQDAGTIISTGYRKVIIRYRRYFAHRLVWLHVHGVWPTGGLDHINGHRSDNRLANLREATPRQNVLNRIAQGGRPLKGITKANGRWRAQIRHDDKNIYLGSFDSAEEAHAAYATAALRWHGEFARV